jgi:membrane protease YdiL (CAAX protease family)
MSIDPATVDLALAAAGAVGLLVLAESGYAARWRSAIEPVLLRTEHVVLPILVFLIVHQVVVSATPMFQETQPVALPAGQDPSIEVSLLANLAAQAAAGTACLVVAGLRFPGRLRGFLMGSISVWRALLWAIGGLLAATPLCLLAQWFSILLLQWFIPGFEPPAHEVLELMQRSDLPGWLPPMLWTAAVVVAPLAEESFFRGLFQTGLGQIVRPRPAAAAGAAILFGAAHASQPHAILPLVILGYVLGYIYDRSGALLAPVMMHALFNLKSMLFAALEAAAP